MHVPFDRIGFNTPTIIKGWILEFRLVSAQWDFSTTYMPMMPDDADHPPPQIVRVVLDVPLVQEDDVPLDDRIALDEPPASRRVEHPDTSG